jgi:hypothetical protein
MLANITSIMHTGVPARYPKLRAVFTEADIGWVPCMAWRMDKYYKQYGTPLQLAKILSRFFGTFLSRVLSFYIDKELPLNAGAERVSRSSYRGSLSR